VATRLHRTRDPRGQKLIAGVLADLERLSATKAIAAVQSRQMFTHNRSEDKVAKGQLRSNREKKKPKADKNKKKSAPEASPFSSARLTGNMVQGGVGKKFS
jgi:hypothetical protein